MVKEEVGQRSHRLVPCKHTSGSENSRALSAERTQKRESWGRGSQTTPAPPGPSQPGTPLSPPAAVCVSPQLLPTANYKFLQSAAALLMHTGTGRAASDYVPSRGHRRSGLPRAQHRAASRGKWRRRQLSSLWSPK